MGSSPLNYISYLHLLGAPPYGSSTLWELLIFSLVRYWNPGLTYIVGCRGVTQLGGLVPVL